MLIKETIQTEVEYVKNLETLEHLFLTPLREPPGCCILSQTEVQTLFGMVPNLLTYNRSLLLRLQERWRCFAFVPCIGDLFVEYSWVFKSYAQYVVNYRKALALLTKLRTHARFQAFCEEAWKSPEATGITSLSSLLIRPVQRIPRYGLLLKELVKHTPQEHQDYSSLNKALVQLSDTASFVESQARLADQLEQAVSVQQTITGYDLFSHHRRFLREGAIEVKGELRADWVMLFHDCLVFCNRTIGKPKKFRAMMGQCDATTHLAVSTVPPTIVRFVLTFPSLPDRDSWVTLVAQAVTDRRTEAEAVEPGVAPAPVATESLSCEQLQPTASNLLSRVLHGAAATGSMSTVHIFGGLVLNDQGTLIPSDDLLTFDTEKREVRPVDGARGERPSPRYGHTCVQVGGRLYIFGGVAQFDDGHWRPTNEMYVLDLATLSWHFIAIDGRFPPPRWGHTATAWGSKIIVVGGCSVCPASVLPGRTGSTWGDAGMPLQQAYYSDVHLFNTETLVWEILPTAALLPSARARACHVAALYRNQLILWGGLGPRGLAPDLAVLTGDMQWKWPVTPTPREEPSLRYGHVAVNVGRHLFLLGGSNLKGHEDPTLAHVLDLERFGWSRRRITGTVPGPLLFHTATLTGVSVCLIGGEVAPGAPSSSVYALYVVSENRAALLQEVRQRAPLARAQAERVYLATRNLEGAAAPHRLIEEKMTAALTFMNQVSPVKVSPLLPTVATSALEPLFFATMASSFSAFFLLPPVQGIPGQPNSNESTSGAGGRRLSIGAMTAALAETHARVSGQPRHGMAGSSSLSSLPPRVSTPMQGPPLRYPPPPQSASPFPMPIASPPVSTPAAMVNPLDPFAREEAFAPISAMPAPTASPVGSECESEMGSRRMTREERAAVIANARAAQSAKTVVAAAIPAHMPVIMPPASSPSPSGGIPPAPQSKRTPPPIPTRRLSIGQGTSPLATPPPRSSPSATTSASPAPPPADPVQLDLFRKQLLDITDQMCKLQARLTEMEGRNQQLETRNRELEGRNRELETQVAALQGAPR
ncbi:putative Guanine exchange factor for Rac 30 [Paratrimastix pyriformis]|uniref:Guanine exchange factor for Rac 30 n=1 Tax=Paratrimastix pyriformis TaxID=342808 RepID=A0ABQ8UKC1_9EUKA|nr:putative Guanine exchange factor for Rac 30 [Paratrimastix pyriformis]